LIEAGVQLAREVAAADARVCRYKVVMSVSIAATL